MLRLNLFHLLFVDHQVITLAENTKRAAHLKNELLFV